MLKAVTSRSGMPMQAWRAAPKPNFPMERPGICGQKLSVFHSTEASSAENVPRESKLKPPICSETSTVSEYLSPVRMTPIEGLSVGGARVFLEQKAETVVRGVRAPPGVVLRLHADVLASDPTCVAHHGKGAVVVVRALEAVGGEDPRPKVQRGRARTARTVIASIASLAGVVARVAVC
eukprot:scaffold263840_cov40-Prasinocladus_malaysianus.AAC.1